MGRPIIVAGNWKMNHGPAEAREFFADFAPRHSSEVVIVVFPPAITFPAAKAALPESPPVRLGVQNVHWEAKGAYTGEISAPMAVRAGATHVLVGHSERRHVFGETDEEVARKVAAVARAGATPVICVGETIQERRADAVEATILRQLEAGIAPLLELDPPGLVIAYEPVWAIGTGETASPSDAAHAHSVIRSRLEDVRGRGSGREVPILYGGSVNPENASELLAAPGVDGVLVGGASLDPRSFARIVEVAAGDGDLP